MLTQGCGDNQSHLNSIHVVRDLFNASKKVEKIYVEQLYYIPFASLLVIYSGYRNEIRTINIHQGSYFGLRYGSTCAHWKNNQALLGHLLSWTMWQVKVEGLLRQWPANYFSHRDISRGRSRDCRGLSCRLYAGWYYLYLWVTPLIGIGRPGPNFTRSLLSEQVVYVDIQASMPR